MSVNPLAINTLGMLAAPIQQIVGGSRRVSSLSVGVAKPAQVSVNQRRISVGIAEKRLIVEVKNDG